MALKNQILKIISRVFFNNKVKALCTVNDKNINTYKIQNWQISILRDMDWAFNNGIYYEINVEYWLNKILKEIKDPILYDIGSNYGYYSVIFSSITKRIYSFEPVGDTYKILRRNIKCNKLPNVQLFNIALSDKKETTFINVYSSSGNNSMFKREIPVDHPTKYLKKIKIKTDTIDSLIKEGIISVPNIIKIDVEGAELNVLNGAMNTIKEFHPILLVEYSETTSKDAGYSCRDIYDFINSCDYTIYGLSENCSDLSLIPFEVGSNVPISNILAFPKQYKIPQ